MMTVEETDLWMLNEISLPPNHRDLIRKYLDGCKKFAEILKLQCETENLAPAQLIDASAWHICR